MRFLIWETRYETNVLNINVLILVHITSALVLTGSYLQFRHIIHIDGPLGLCGRIRGGRFVLQLAEGVLHRRQGINDERERGGLTFRLLSAPSLALVQRQIPHAVIGSAAVIVVGEFLERRPR